MEKDVFFIPDKYGDALYVLMSYDTYKGLTEKRGFPTFHDMTVADMRAFIHNLKEFFREHQDMFRLLIGAEEFGKSVEAMVHTEGETDENRD